MVARVLLVDDLDAMRSILRIQLRIAEAGQVVAEAATSEEASSLARNIRPDVVVLDLLLPDAPGRDTFAAIRRASPDSAVMVFSASESDHRWYVDQGAVYFRKSDGTSRLLRAIKAS